MPNKDFQRHTFLGGEVSPSLYERADMDHFSKWFSKAENIRFFETGGFRNRPGFVKVADTKYNQAGQTIKLLSFSFNDEESFLVELGPNYARFFRNGSPIYKNGSLYEIPTPLDSFTGKDLKYAQSGDIVFITHPTYGIYELSRLEADGSSWSFKPFNASIFPMKKENENKNSTLAISQYSGTIKKVSLELPGNAMPGYKEVSFTYNSDVIFASSSCSQEELLVGVKAALLEISEHLNAYIEGEYLCINSYSVDVTPSDFSISYKYEYLSDNTEIDTDYQSGSDGSRHSVSASISYAGFYSFSSLQASSYGYGRHSNTIDLSVYTTKEDALLAISGLGSFSNQYCNSQGVQINYATQTISLSVNRTPGEGATIEAGLQLVGKVSNLSNEVVNNSISESGTILGRYTMTALDPLFFNNLEIGQTVLVKNDVDTQALTGSYSVANTYTLGPVKSNGKWRCYSLGNWVGSVTLQFSTDNQQTWVDYQKWDSQDANNTPYNFNTSGTIEFNDLIWFRIKVSLSSSGTSPLQISFFADSFTTNSYYKILTKINNYTAIVECIKNDVGAFSNNWMWRTPAFSNSEGWPQTIGFYQNRLFFGKDYILYGSKSNDFWDFYEPIELGDSDPVTMSLLSTKVNNIKNIVTQRSFFTFTGGGEFGIGSEGALTQADKHLKPFSSNGSAQCNPVLVSDVVLFVDKSYNSVRALKYSLESDGYEAPDITLTLKYLLRNEKIISTDIIYEEKEALFLSDTGIIWVLKYIPDQNVLSWSHLKHAFGKITNICVVPNGAKNDLYIAVENAGRKWIEKLQEGNFLDTLERFQATAATKVPVSGGALGQKRVICQDGKYHTVSVDSNGEIDITDFNSNPFAVGAAYTTTATLLSPAINYDEYSKTTYHKKNPYKVWFYYTDSYGFKVGVEEDEKMAIEWQNAGSDIDDETNLTSGKKSVLIPSSFSHSGRVTFVQDKPYPMEIQDVLIETDIGGK